MNTRSPDNIVPAPLKRNHFFPAGILHSCNVTICHVIHVFVLCCPVGIMQNCTAIKLETFEFRKILHVASVHDHVIATQ